MFLEIHEMNDIRKGQVYLNRFNDLQFRVIGSHKTGVWEYFRGEYIDSGNEMVWRNAEFIRNARDGWFVKVRECANSK